MKELLKLFWIFAKIGSVTFGGGYAMLPILTREFVDKLHWVTDEELTDYFAIGQCTPGVIAVNVATFIGNKRKGLVGGIVATVGVVTVPLLIVTVIAAFLRNFADYEIVKNAFAGIRVCVCVLILNAILRLWSKSIVDKITLVVFAVIFLISVTKDYIGIDVSPVVMVIVAALFGIVYNSIKISTAAKGGKKE